MLIRLPALLLLLVVRGYMPDFTVAKRLAEALQQVTLLDLLSSLKEERMFASPRDESTEKCLQKLKLMINHAVSDRAMLNFIKYSGKGIGDIGDYEGCNAESSISYYMIFAVQVNEIVGGRAAFCLPNECPPQVAEQTKAPIAALVTDYFHMTFTAEQVVMEYPKPENAALNKMKLGGKLFMGLSFVLIGFILAITIMDRYSCLHPETGWRKALGCFSLQQNVRLLFACGNPFDPKLEVFNGIRLLGISWIVLGHYHVSLMLAPIFNFLEAVNAIFSSFPMGVIKAANLASDIFFFMSGFFAAMSTYRILRIPENRTWKCVGTIYLHRYVRLLPVFLFGMLGTVFILPTLYDSPLSSWAGPQVQLCEDQWQYCFLFMNNFMSKFYGACMAWLWYVQNDMQFFLLAPLIMLIFSRGKRWGFFVIVSLCIVSLAVQTSIISYYKFSLSSTKLDLQHDMSTITFIKPYCRFLTYAMGMIVYLMYEEPNDPVNGIGPFICLKRVIYEHNTLRHVIYAIGTVIMCICIYGFYFMDHYPDTWGTTFGMVHMVVVRPLFILGLTMVVYPVLIGRGKVILAIFGHYIFNPIAKVTYGTYMLHLPLIGVARFITVQGRFYRPLESILSAVGIIFMSYVFSTVVTMIYDFPTMRLFREYVEKGLKRHSNAVEDTAELKKLT